MRFPDLLKQKDPYYIDTRMGRAINVPEGEYNAEYDQWIKRKILESVEDNEYAGIHPNYDHIGTDLVYLMNRGWGENLQKVPHLPKGEASEFLANVSKLHEQNDNKDTGFTTALGSCYRNLDMAFPDNTNKLAE